MDSDSYYQPRENDWVRYEQKMEEITNDIRDADPDLTDEEVEALANIEEILRVDNIDVFFVAPSDLAQTLGHIGDIGHPEVQSAIDGAIARIVAAGRTAGTLVNDDSLGAYVEKGARFVMTSWNAWLTRGARDFLGKVASAKP